MLRCRLDRLRKFPMKSETGFCLDSSRRQLPATWSAFTYRFIVFWAIILWLYRDKTLVSTIKKVYKTHTCVCIISRYNIFVWNWHRNLKLETIYKSLIGIFEMLKKEILNKQKSRYMRFNLIIKSLYFRHISLFSNLNCDRDNDILLGNNSRFSFSVILGGRHEFEHRYTRLKQWQASN